MPKPVVLVTGNAGFIGSHLTNTLLKLHYPVIGVDNFNSYYDPLIKEKNIHSALKNKSFRQYRADILDKKLLEKIFQTHRPQIVVHLAARAGVRPSIDNPELYHQVNVDGTKNLLDLAKKYKIRQFIFTSSSSVYGDQKKVPFSETDALSPVSPYAATKLEAEKLCQQSDLPMTILRFFTVYGPGGRPDIAPYIFTKKILNGEPIIRFGDGTTSRDYTYIDDIITGIVAVLGKTWQCEIINLGNNHPVQLNDFIKTIESITGKKAKIIEQPRHPADVPQTYADITKAKKLLHWQPKTDLKTGLTKLIKWFKFTQPIHHQ